MIDLCFLQIYGKFLENYLSNIFFIMQIKDSIFFKSTSGGDFFFL